MAPLWLNSPRPTIHTVNKPPPDAHRRRELTGQALVSCHLEATQSTPRDRPGFSVIVLDGYDGGSPFTHTTGTDFVSAQFDAVAISMWNASFVPVSFVWGNYEAFF